MSTGILGLGEAESSTKGLEGVGVVRRGVARLIDLGVLAVVFALAAPSAFLLALLWADLFGAPAYAAIEKLLAATDAGEWSFGALGDRLLELAAIVVMHSVWEGLHGSTIGKRLCGITVVSEDGTPAGLAAGAKRSLAFVLDQLGFGLLGAYRISRSPQAQRIGDEWADTMVVRIADLPAALHRGGVRFVTAVLAGVAAGGFVVVLGISAWIGFHTRLSAEDRVAIVSAVQRPPAPFRPGETVTFAVRVTHVLKSDPRGTLRLFVLGESPSPAGELRVIQGRGFGTLTAVVTIPEYRPGYSQPGVIRLGVGLFPAANVTSPSADHVFDLEILPCDPTAPMEASEQLCTA